LIHSFEDEPYSGGNCVTVKGSLQQNEIFSEQLFNGGLSMEGESVYVFYSVSNLSFRLYHAILTLAKRLSTLATCPRHILEKQKKQAKAYFYLDIASSLKERYMCICTLACYLF